MLPTLLIVEDERATREGLRSALEDEFDVYTASGTSEALAILDAVGSDNLFVQYDVYHAQRMEGELGSTLKNQLSRIGHIQIADNPGRNEPGTGEINYAWVLNHIDSIGYDGWVGCEYKPKTTTVEGLGWMKAFA